MERGSLACPNDPSSWQWGGLKIRAPSGGCEEKKSDDNETERNRLERGGGAKLAQRTKSNFGLILFRSFRCFRGLSHPCFFSLNSG